MHTLPPAGALAAPTRRDWGSASWLTPELCRIRLKNPFGPLMVNTWVYRTPQTLAVVDPGWPWTLAALEQALVALGLARGFADVNHWLYTHTHIDHAGAIALFQRHSDAPHLILRSATKHLSHWHSMQDRMNDWSPWVAEAFAEPHRSQALDRYAQRRVDGGRRTMLEEHGEGVVDLERTKIVDFGDVVRVGELDLHIVDARGHDMHHIALWEPERRWLFSGDVVLATPTPISRAMEDELDAYMHSLARLEALDAALLMPGHGTHAEGEEVVKSIARSRAAVRGYEEGLLRTLDRLDGPRDLFHLGLEMTPERERLTPEARWWVHLALVDTHLHALITRGDVERIEAVTGPLYMLA